MSEIEPPADAPPLPGDPAPHRAPPPAAGPPAEPSPAGPPAESPAAGPPAEPSPADDRGSSRAPSPARRPLVERLGLSAIALVLALLFVVVALAAWTNGEGFLAVMAGIGALMTAWAGAITLLRG